MRTIVKFWVLALAALGGCDRGIYTADGVTDGDTFYLAEYANFDIDPVVQAWVAYSLDLSHCQLKMGGENPARNSSFDCELSARHALVDRYSELKDRSPDLNNPYLADLTVVRTSGYMDEYVVAYFGRRGWNNPPDLDLNAFKKWRRSALKGHKPERRIIGSWNFRETKSDAEQ